MTNLRMTKEDLVNEYKSEKGMYKFYLHYKDHTWYDDPDDSIRLSSKCCHYAPHIVGLIRSGLLPECFKAAGYHIKTLGEKHINVY